MQTVLAYFYLVPLGFFLIAGALVGLNWKRPQRSLIWIGSGLVSGSAYVIIPALFALSRKIRQRISISADYINTALRTYQKQRFDHEYSGYEQLPDSPVDPDAISTLSEAELMRVINQLPEGYRVVFNLVAIEGYSHAEVAETLGIQESTSRSQLTKARRWLCEQIEILHKINA